MSSATSSYARSLVKVAIGEILQTVGFHSAQSTALDILVEVLERYVLLICRTTHDLAELANRTEPTLDDLAVAFEKHHVSLAELDEFLNWVDTPEYRLSRHVKAAPELVVKPKKLARDYLGFCDNSKNHKEILERESDEEWEHIYDYMPLMTQSNKADESNKSVSLDQEPTPVDTTMPNIIDLSLSTNQTTNPTDNNNMKNLPSTTAQPTALSSSFNGAQKEDYLPSVSMIQLPPAQAPTSLVEKNGVKYPNYSWKSMYDSKHAFSRGRVVINRRLSQIGSLNDSMCGGRETPCLPTAKLPAEFHKPISKYKKSIYNNAVSIYNKSISVTSGQQTALEEMIDEERLQKQAATVQHQEQVQVSEMTREEKTSVVVETPKVVLAGGAATTTVSEANELVKVGDVAVIASGENDSNDITGGVVKLSSQTSQSSAVAAPKSRVDEMLEAYLTKYSPASATSTPTASATNAPIKIKLFNQSSASIAGDESKKQNSEASPVPTIPKLKISTLFGSAASGTKGADSFQIEEFSTTNATTTNSGSSRLTSNDHIDDNAMDVDDMIKTSSVINNPATKVSVNDEHLIWKPVTTKISEVAKSPKSSRQKSPPVKPNQSDSNKINPITTALLVDYSSNSLETSQMGGANLASGGSESATTGTEQKQQQKQTKQSQDGDQQLTVGASSLSSSTSKHKKKKKNKEKEKEKEKDKEKTKEKDKDKDKKHHHHHHHKKKDKEKSHKQSEEPLSPSSLKKKDKKLKKMLKKEQKKLRSLSSTASAATESVSNLAAPDPGTDEERNANSSLAVDESSMSSKVNTSLTHTSPPISIKISKSALESSAKESKVPIPTNASTPQVAPPPLPKLKLKITSNEPAKQIKPDSSQSATSNTPINPSPNMVKPLKINLNKPNISKPQQHPSQPPPKSTSTTKELDEDEIELGEVIKPKSTVPSSSKMSSGPHPPLERISPIQLANKMTNPSQGVSNQIPKPKQPTMKSMTKPNVSGSNNVTLNTSNQVRKESNQPSANVTTESKLLKSKSSSQQQQQRNVDLDAATALLMNTQSHISPDLASNLASFAATDPANASSLLTSLPILLALQAHSQAALNQLNASQRDQSETFQTPSQKKPNTTLLNRQQSTSGISSSNNNGNKQTNPSPTNAGQQSASPLPHPRMSPAEQMIVKKRKQSDDLTLKLVGPSTSNDANSSSSSCQSTAIMMKNNNSKNSSNTNNGMNKPKVKQPPRNEFGGEVAQYIESLARTSKESSDKSTGGGSGGVIGSGDDSMISEDYGSSNEFLWHRKRVQQEEQQLQEQLELLRRGSTPQPSSSGSSTPGPGSSKMMASLGGGQKRSSLQPGEGGTSMMMKPGSSGSKQSSQNMGNISMKIQPKKPQASDMETIFTPVITPVIKNRVSPSQGSTTGSVQLAGGTNNSSKTASSITMNPNSSSSSGRINIKTSTTAISPNLESSSNKLVTSSQLQAHSKTSTTSSKLGTPMTIIGTAVECTDVVSNQLWICPTCNKPDDSVPMIGCDSCDDWYHWHCIGITREPPKNQNWYCHKCSSQSHTSATSTAPGTTSIAAGPSVSSNTLIDEPTSVEMKSVANEEAISSKNDSSFRPNESSSQDVSESSNDKSFSSIIGSGNSGAAGASGTSIFNTGFGSTGSDYLSSLKKKKKKA